MNMLKPFKIKELNIPHQLIQAPMCGITHKPFRGLLKKYGAGLTFTQMASAKALSMGDEKSRRLLSYCESERPIGFQLFGNDAEVLAIGASVAQDMGADLVDLNMGCPAKKITSDGGGAALLKDSSLAKNIFTKMRSILKIPFTIKMRSGWDKYHMESIYLAKMAQDCGVDAVSIHARTCAQGYQGHSNWDLIGEFKENLSIPVIGNGDVVSLNDIEKMIQTTKCDGVMVGRVSVTQPWFFKSFVDGKDYTPTPLEMKEVILSQYESFFDFFGRTNGIKMMRKHLCAYTKGIRNGAAFRSKAIVMDNWELLKSEIDHFFDAQLQ